MSNDSEESPWNEEQHAVPDDMGIRPIRLAKRQETRKSSTSATSSAHLRASSTASTSHQHSRNSSEEVQLRPMRLGSASTVNYRKDSHRLSSHNLAMKPDDLDPILSESIGSGSGSTSGAASTTVSATASIAENTPTSSLSQTKRSSIQIKNLPIAVSPLKNTFSSSTVVAASGRQVDDMIFAICVVDFHHLRGPEIQWWKSNYHPEYTQLLFKNLSFQALPDGSHLFEETFSNFNLVYDFQNSESIDNMLDLNDYQGDPRHLRTLFGCSCVRQVKTSDLSQEERDRNKDITRSIVQKAIVIIVRKQPIFTKIREKLSIITKSYFQQDNFNNVELLENLFDNLNNTFKLIDNELEENTKFTYEFSEQQKSIAKEEENFVNLNLKNTILKFKANFLTIFKSLLLDKKILIFSNSSLEMLTQFQNNLISLIPNLINNLDNSGCPLIDYVETNGPLAKPNSLNTTNRRSMLRFFGLPLQIFNTKNAFWNPYLPLQQLDELTVESFMVGCSNLLFVNQAEKYNIDLLINLDTCEISFPSGKQDELGLSHADKKFINHLINNIENERDDEFLGNDDYIRYQFEDYLNSLISTTRYAQYVDKFSQAPPGFGTGDVNFGNLSLFNIKFVDKWRLSYNYRIWNAMADEFIFNFMDPKHLAVEFPETHASYNLSNFFSFKLKGSTDQQSTTHTANDPRPQKFIADEKIISSDKSAEETKPHPAKAGWTSGWGFKKG